MKSMEIFKDIEGYEGLYMISSWGRVKRIRDNSFLNPEITKKGYLRVSLYKNKTRKHFKIHRLVAFAFIDNADNKPQINHKDGNKINNSFTNLEWCTDEENKEHRKLLIEE